MTWRNRQNKCALRESVQSDKSIYCVLSGCRDPSFPYTGSEDPDQRERDSRT